MKWYEFDSSGPEYVRVAGCCEYCNEPSGWLDILTLWTSIKPISERRAVLRGVGYIFRFVPSLLKIWTYGSLRNVCSHCCFSLSLKMQSTALTFWGSLNSFDPIYTQEDYTEWQILDFVSDVKCFKAIFNMQICVTTLLFAYARCRPVPFPSVAEMGKCCARQNGTHSFCCVCMHRLIAFVAAVIVFALYSLGVVCPLLFV
jgi:hypothetical protein